ncbi:hypothetical protein [Nocardioides sp.]|uniref:hypothetical protein n=1 Tax=Nocardioides sp. TaxID=35761 RepID=UPI0031FEE41E|nr:hypothetical protein [Nocardioides sp.]
MSTAAHERDWQRVSAEGLAGLSLDSLPAAELLFLDALAAYLMGPEAPESPYTIEQGTVIVGHLLRAVVDASKLELESSPPGSDEMSEARTAVLEGAHQFASRGVPGVKQLVNRFLAAAVGELEIHRESAEAQTRSLFYYGLLAVASGPNNRLTQAAAEGIMDVFTAWDAQIGAGFVPPWRVVATT